MLAASQCVFAYARRMLLPRTYSPVSGRTALQHILQFFELLWIRLGRNDPCRQVRKRRAFAQLRRRCYCRGIRRIHPKQQIAAYEPARRVSLLLCLCMAHCLRANFSFSNCCGFGRDAMFHADRFANAGRLLTVAAFAVYSQINRSPLTSQLDASHCCFVCAWLIAYAQISGEAGTETFSLTI